MICRAVVQEYNITPFNDDVVNRKAAFIKVDVKGTDIYSDDVEVMERIGLKDKFISITPISITQFHDAGMTETFRTLCHNNVFTYSDGIFTKLPKKEVDILLGL